MKMNDMQYLAAYGEFDKNVLVSAGAGSGKTQVLTTRVTNLVDNGVRPSKLLVLTFTNAAAAEMKDRVRDMLVSKNKPSDLLGELEQAYITTFDSFNLAICRKYFYKLNISPDLTICDSNAMGEKKKEIINQILDELYIKADLDLFSYLDKFSTKKDDNLVNNILNLIKSLDKIEDSISYIEDYDNNYFSEDFISKITLEYLKTLTPCIERYKESIINLLNECGNQESINTLNHILALLINKNGYEDYLNAISFEIPKKNAKFDSKGFSDQRKIVIKCISELKAMMPYKTLDELKEEHLESKNTINLFRRILKEYYIRISKFENKYNVYEFNDIQKMAIKLVKENEDVKEELKSSFKEILIDEYQDTSDLQETFISYLANNNLFMVGDVKQSIYRFRNANPIIFKNKYMSYHPINKDTYPSLKEEYKDKKGYLIDMNQNFRSRREVLDDINDIFNVLMTNEVGDANYRESHNMLFGLKLYDDGLCTEECGFKSDYIEYDNSEIDIEDEMCEAYIIAKDIIGKVGKYEVYSKKEGKFRKATYNDFCIIIDRQKCFDSIKKVLESYGIPVVINADQKIQESYVSMVAINLMKLVGYSYILSNDFEAFNKIEKDYYHALASVLRSFIYEYSEEDILKIVRGRDLNNEASLLAKEISKKVDKLDNSLLFQTILNEFDFYTSIIKIGDTNKSLHEIEFISNKCRDLSNLGYHFTDISLKLSNMMVSEDEVKYSIDVSNSNGVKMMNVHKSKGLEFPICYFCDLKHVYNTQNIKSSVGFDKEYGIYVPIYKNGVCDTFIRTLSNRNWVNMTVSERLRVFYVGLTRAREKMIFIRNVSKATKLNETEDQKSFAQYFEYLNDKKAISFNQKFFDSSYFEELKDLDLLRYRNTKTILVNDTHPYKPLNLNNNLVNESRISKTMQSVMNKKIKSAIDAGLMYHEILEMLDMKKPFESLENMNLDDKAKEIINKVLNLDIMKNIKVSKALKEHEFTTIIDNISYHGIIDLLAVYDDHIDIIDYKLSNFDDLAYDRQLSIYASYVKTKTNLPVNCYLLSIIDAKVRKVDL